MAAAARETSQAAPAGAPTMFCDEACAHRPP